MYRIEVRAGEETVFRTIEELATGIRNGFITPRARIFHAASQKWLPIEFHPHYKKALEGDFTPAAPGPQPSLAAMPAPTFAFPGATPAGQPPAPAPDPSPIPAVPPTPVMTAAESPVFAMRAAVRRPNGGAGEAEAEDGPIERYSPVAVVVEAPRPAPAPATLPAVVLPNITYPELPPMEQSEHRATARRSRRAGGRPFLLVGTAALLVFAGQRYLASRGIAGEAEVPSVEAAATPVNAEPAMRADAKPSAARRAESAPTQAARPNSAPAQAPAQRPEPLVPPPSRAMSPGPAFAASVPARGTSPSPAPAAPAAAPPPASIGSRPGPRPDSAAIAPAPAAIQLDVPGLLPGESIAPTLDEGRDSLAIKRILKAVTGRKANPTAR
jgi:hypothetical protein